MIGGLAKQAQRYQPALDTAVLKTLKSYRENRGELSAFEQKAAVPVSDGEAFAKADWQEFSEEDWEALVDDVHGTPSRADLVRAAREKEFQWVRKEDIYEEVPLLHATRKRARHQWTIVGWTLTKVTTMDLLTRAGW